METTNTSELETQPPTGSIASPSSDRIAPVGLSSFWSLVLIAWCAVLCLAHDPRPLGAPRWAVEGLQSTLRLSETRAMVLATVALRASGLAILGLLLSLCLRRVPLRFAAPLVIVVTPLLAIGCQWINYGHFPIFLQLQLGLASSLLGAIGGLAVHRSWIAGAVLIAVLGAAYLWGTSTKISDDLAANARTSGQYLLDRVDQISAGDQGFVDLLELAFQFASDNSHGTTAVETNKAAILALGYILGEERIARIAQQTIKIERPEAIAALRRRVLLRGRGDLPRHFWVSASLVILSDENRAMTVGLGKEMMDATGGGSGFSFVDMLANRGGILLALAATKNESMAREFQDRIREGVELDDYFPSIQDLPEGFTMDEFQAKFGGLGGAETLKLKQEIEDRLATCKGLKSQP